MTAIAERSSLLESIARLKAERKAATSERALRVLGEWMTPSVVQ